jgi:F420-dependent oxidoreductase-like protein
MKFGLQHPSFSYDYDRKDVSQIAVSLKNLIRNAESSDFDSFWVMDHFHQISAVGKPQEPMLEGWTTISFLAAVTSKIKLGTLVTGIIYRYPSLLAKVGATLDVLSNGRLFMGIGAAWNYEESAAYGIPFPSTKDRFLMLEEAVQVIRKMWSKEEGGGNTATSSNGKFYKLHDAYCNPKPVQEPMPPIMIGGSGERKTLKIVAKYADACNIFGSPETIRRKLSSLSEHCKTVNRDYNTILKTKLTRIIIANEEELVKKRVNESFIGISEETRREFAIYGTPEQIIDQIELFKEAGIDYLIVNFEPQRESESLELFANKVMRICSNL